MGHTAFLILHAIQTILIILGVFAIYLLPSIIAFRRKHPQKVPVILCNVLLGLTGIGWAVALIWAFWNYEDRNQKESVMMKSQGEQ